MSCRRKKNVSLRQRNGIWREICQQVNTLSPTVRAVEEVTRRFHDLPEADVRIAGVKKKKNK